MFGIYEVFIKTHFSINLSVAVYKEIRDVITKPKSLTSSLSTKKFIRNLITATALKITRAEMFLPEKGSIKAKNT